MSGKREPGVTKVRDGQSWRWAGVLRQSGKIIWQCEHLHVNRDNDGRSHRAARTCAEQEARQRWGSLTNWVDSNEATVARPGTAATPETALGDAAVAVLDSLDDDGFVTRQARDRLRQAVKDAWLDLP